MARIFRKRNKQAGASPGTLVHVGDKKIEQPVIALTRFSVEQVEERQLSSVDEGWPPHGDDQVSWLNICGLHDTSIIQRVGERLGVHPLVQEDILSTMQHPKVEDFGEYLFVVMKMLSYESERGGLVVEQVSFLLADHLLISFQERPGSVFDPVRDRLRAGRGRMRKLGPDYLLYALIDAVVDHYFTVLERMGEQIENLEDAIMGSPTPHSLRGIHRLKRDMIILRKSVWPLREVVGSMLRGESALVREQTGVFLRDVYDHVIQIIDMVETYRDMLTSMLDVYLSSMSNKMNEIMKVLTVIATIFIPLTFLAGVYGMNFEYMPELKWRFGYFLFWGVALLTALGLGVFFRKRRWI